MFRGASALGRPNMAIELVGLAGTLHPKPHRSRGDQESAFGLDQALVAVRTVAVVDVVGHRLLGCVPVGVVGVVDDELVDRPEVAFDPVQETGLGRGEHQLDVVGHSQGPRCGPRRRQSAVAGYGRRAAGRRASLWSPCERPGCPFPEDSALCTCLCLRHVTEHAPRPHLVCRR